MSDIEFWSLHYKATHSTYWEWMKRHCRERGRGKCERCGHETANPCEHLHHRYYYKNGVCILTKEDPSDLEYLCAACHRFRHFKGAYDPLSHASKVPTDATLLAMMRDDYEPKKKTSTRTSYMDRVDADLEKWLNDW